ncbi:MAG: hypothetical protein WBR13_11285 [Allosphingosinicella sp.]
MRRFTLHASILTALAAVPAGAQIAGKRDYGPVAVSSPFLQDSRLPGPGIGRQLRDLDRDIDRARESGRLSGREARRLEREARAVGRLARRYGRDGLSPSERAELEARANYLRDSVGRPRRGG